MGSCSQEVFLPQIWYSPPEPPLGTTRTSILSTETEATVPKRSERLAVVVIVTKESDITSTLVFARFEDTLDKAVKIQI